MSDKRISSLYDYARVCRHYVGADDDMCLCSKCPLSEENNNTKESCAVFVSQNTDKANEVVLKWIDEHPAKTRQSELIKLFPNAKLLNGTIDVLPCSMDRTVKNNPKYNSSNCVFQCNECRKKFWLEEIE